MAEREKFKKGKIAEIEKKKKRKNINNELVKKYFTDYERPSELHKTES